MRTLLIPVILMASLPAAAQSVGTASRTVSLAPEEVVVEIVLATPATIVLDQAVALMAPLGVAARDLRSVGSLRETPDQIGWQFGITRPYRTLDDTLKRLDQLRRQLLEKGVHVTYQFFLRASPETFDTTRRKVISELLSEARRNAGNSGKLRTVIVEPTPETVDAGRPAMLFGQASGALQYNFKVIAFFESD